MLSGFLVFILSLAYIGLLFVIAYAGDQQPRLYTRTRHRATIYSLSLAVYCTSWTFYGAVGTATTDGLAYFPIYLGPILIFLLGTPLIERIVRISKRHNSTSIADFIATRYGKSQGLAAMIAVIALFGILPYIALQLKAVSMGFSILTDGQPLPDPAVTPLLQDTALYVAAVMIAFTVLFGTRHVDATEHHHGLMLAIAFESAVKLAALIAVGIFALFLIHPDRLPDPGLLQADGLWTDLVARSPDALTFAVYTLLSALAIICLPRQFHVMVVENHDVTDVRQARWSFPLYLTVLSLFVLPIAAAGLMLFPDQNIHPDTFILALPLMVEQHWLALVVFIGGASAATGMVIMSSVTLSTMLSNEVLVPLMLRLGLLDLERQRTFHQRLLNLRRLTIAAIVFGAWLFSRYTPESISLASIGLLSFVAVAQFAPALLGGLLWRRGNKAGAAAGLLAGIAVWAYTLLLPGLLKGMGSGVGASVLAGPFGLSMLQPEALFGLAGLDPVVHGTLFSLAANLLAYVGVSLLTRQKVIEIIQVASFHELPTSRRDPAAWASSTTVEDLMALGERFMGQERTREALASFSRRYQTELRPDRAVSLELIQHVESYLAGVIGSSSARIVLDTALKGQNMGIEDVVNLVDEASQVMRFSRELLQSAIENLQMGVSVVDRHLNLVAWNRRYLEIFSYPRGFVRVGKPIEAMLRHNLQLSQVPSERIEEIVQTRLRMMREGVAHEYERVKPDGTVILIQGNPMPDGGFVTCFSDITAMRKTELALKETNTYLELRVRERTEALSELNQALSRATQQAEQANLGKTRFLAAASHDLLQPLNAARLLTSALSNQIHQDQPGSEQARLIDHLDSALSSAEEILGTLLDISKLDAGALAPQPRTFAITELFRALGSEFSVIAAERGLRFDMRPCRLHVHTDPQLLRRILQNFLTNAVRYTRQGRVLLGARRRAGRVRLEVWDTGPGIPKDKLTSIFEEFRRLDQGGQGTQGLGLGLAIVERIGRLLGTPVTVRSWPGKGSVFAVEVPIVSAPAETASPTLPESGSAVQFADLAVLCIDNDESILQALQALLRGWGCEVMMARDLSSAWHAIQDRPPRIILADYQLDAEANGLDLMDELRHRLERRVPGILITAVSSDDLRQRTRERGYQFLNKPVKPAALRALMRSLLRGTELP